MKYTFDSEKHCHKLDDRPLLGTTTVIGEILPPMLSWYGSGQAVKSLGWYDRKKSGTNYLSDEIGMPILERSFNEIKEMNPLQFLDKLDVAYKAHNVYMKEKGAWGTETHEAIEIIVKEAIENNNGYLSPIYENETVERFTTWGRGKQFLYSEIYVYSEKCWLGGIIDLVYKENDKFYIADIKTGKGIYESAFIQSGMYDYQQSENGFFTEDGNKLGEALEISGYTIVNISKDGGLLHNTYQGTTQLKEFTTNLMQLFNLLQELKTICKKKNY